MILHSQFQHLPTLLIDTKLARCEIALFGAQVLSFIPREDGRDLLWCSASKLMPGRPVRGGIPICWPWFAKQNVISTSAQHGFVRTMTWEVLHQTENLAGEVSITLVPGELPSLPKDSSPWPAKCRPRLTIHVGEQLHMQLTTSNESAEHLQLTQAMHTYFRVSDVRSVAIDGIQGKRYLDKLLNFVPATQDSAWTFEDGCDRIYLDTASNHAIVDTTWSRTIKVESEGSASTVVWNPGSEGVKAFNDIPSTDWPQYLCVEVANCGPSDSVLLAPGASCTLEQRLSAASNGP